MYKELHIVYCNPYNTNDSFTAKFKIRDTRIAQKWAEKVYKSINTHSIDDPCRFYGFEEYEVEKINSIQKLNNCIDTINNYKKLINKRVSNVIDQDTLNYLHNIFETYHGLLNKQDSEFWLNAPDDVRKALAQLNIEVHRCESFAVDTDRKVAPRHIVTWFGLYKEDMLEIEDYEYFTDFYTFGTVYLLYVEIGKTLEDLSIDNDIYIGDDAYKPFRHYSSDFCVRFFTSTTDSWKTNRKRLKDYYQNNKEFFDNRNLPLSHPYNRPGNIPLADIIHNHYDIIKELKPRQMVKKVLIF